MTKSLMLYKSNQGRKGGFGCISPDQRESVAGREKRELAQEDAKLFSIEEKWIANQINHETYQKWFGINNNRIHLNGAIDRLSMDQSIVYTRLTRT